MSFIEIFLIALGLAMDAFAISIVSAASGYINSPRSIFRISFHFGLFQFLMPVIGWVLGLRIVYLISALDHWIAFVLLGFVGVRMILSSFDQNPESFAGDPSKGFTLVLLSITTSIDALAVGLSLGLLRVHIWYPSVIIGMVTAFLSVIGIWFGYKLSEKFGKKMELIGGFFLIGIGFKILIDHMVFGQTLIILGNFC